MPLDAYGLTPPSQRLQAAIKAIREADPRFDWDCPVYEWPSGFGSLVRVVSGQQLSTTAAGAIFKRLANQVGLTPEAILAAPDEALRGVGLSAAKTVCVRELARAADTLEALDGLDDEAAIQALSAIKGIGRWTAEVYLLFAHGRLDVLPAGDLGILVGYQLMAGLERRPTDKELRAALTHLTPWRGVAGFLLWERYRRRT
ncbi:MAG: 3-methyladenine glycosylase [Cyanobacteria bacterium RYN_339]|nr:3-methyladenine glycosylase [Cyanobacteria bacterium RYN_339]